MIPFLTGAHQVLIATVQLCVLQAAKVGTGFFSPTGQRWMTYAQLAAVCCALVRFGLEVLGGIGTY